MKLVNTLILCLLADIAVCQRTHFTNNDHWKLQRKEVFVGLSLTNFLGDLGGRDQIGTDYSPVDMDWGMTRGGIQLGYRFRFRPWFMFSIRGQYSLFSGDDKLTNEPYRNYRNLHFRTHFFEISPHIEVIFYNNEYFGHRYKIQGLKGKRHKNTLCYLFTGVSTFIFIPQAQFAGSWINLRPLHTEGQGMPDGPEEYGIFSWGIPFGVGYKLALGAVSRISFELSYTKTFTDYLDDVSTNYYDSHLLKSEYGLESFFLSDPSSKEFPSWTKPGEQRGDPTEKDAFLYFSVSYVRNITYKKTGVSFNRARF